MNTNRQGRRTRHAPVQDVSAARDPDALLTVATVAAMIGFSPITLRAWARSGKFPRGILIGRSRRWRARDVRAWMAQRGLTPPGVPPELPPLPALGA